MTAIEDARQVVIRTDEPGRESWAISLTTGTYTDTLRMTEAEARLVHHALGERLTTPPTDDEPWDGSVPNDDYGPWGGTEGCFGHCDPEGWYAKCKEKSVAIAPPAVSDREALARDIKTVRDWAVSETGWDSGAFDRVLDAAERFRRQGPITDADETAMRKHLRFRMGFKPDDARRIAHQLRAALEAARDA